MAELMTKEEFISKVEALRGVGVYDFSESDYVNTQTKFTVKHIKCGFSFEANPAHLLNSKSKAVICPICGSGVKTTESFVYKAKRIHGDKFDYSNTVYKGATTHLSITCKKHGHEFTQTPSKHYMAKDCPICIGNRKKTPEEFIRQATEKHNGKYTYPNVCYKGTDYAINAYCTKHNHHFTVTAKAHLTGTKGCKFCADKPVTRHTTETAKARILDKVGNKFGLDKFEYHSDGCKSLFYCYDHQGYFEATLSRITTGMTGCPICNASTKKTTEQFILEAKEVHGDKYDYSNAVYRTARTPLAIKCNTCNSTFNQRPTDHVSKKNGCPSCAGVFVLNKPTILYYLSIDTGTSTLYKIGITNKTVKERIDDFCKDIALDVKILHTQDFADGNEAKQHETAVKAMYESAQYRGPNILATGNSELFTSDVLDGGRDF